MQFFSILLLASVAVAVPAPIVALDRHAASSKVHHSRAKTDHVVKATSTKPVVAQATAAAAVTTAAEADATNFVKHAGMKIGIPQVTAAPHI